MPVRFSGQHNVLSLGVAIPPLIASQTLPILSLTRITLGAHHGQFHQRFFTSCQSAQGEDTNRLLRWLVGSRCAPTLHCPGLPSPNFENGRLHTRSHKWIPDRSVLLVQTGQPSPSSPDWIQWQTVTQPVIVHHSIHLVCQDWLGCFRRSALSQGSCHAFNGGPLLLARPPCRGGWGCFNPTDQPGGKLLSCIGYRAVNFINTLSRSGPKPTWVATA